MELELALFSPHKVSQSMLLRTLWVRDFSCYAKSKDSLVSSTSQMFEILENLPLRTEFRSVENTLHAVKGISYKVWHRGRQS